MEVARPAGPPPTMSTSNGSTSRATSSVEAAEAAEVKPRAAKGRGTEGVVLMKKDAGDRRKAGVVAAAAPDAVAVERSFVVRRFILPFPIDREDDDENDDDETTAGRTCRRRRLFVNPQQLLLLRRRRRAAACIERGAEEDGYIRRQKGWGEGRRRSVSMGSGERIFFENRRVMRPFGRSQRFSTIGRRTNNGPPRKGSGGSREKHERNSSNYICTTCCTSARPKKTRTDCLFARTIVAPHTASQSRLDNQPDSYHHAAI
jgi:hypothetical protein